MGTNKIRIVVNPAAGSGKAKAAARMLMQRIRNISNYDFQITYSKYKDDAMYITREAVTEGAALVIAVGGDGTINEVVNGFFTGREPVNPSCELGIINCGTGGGFSGTMNNPRSPEQQIGQLFQARSTVLDLGHITCQGYSGETVSRIFVNECQLGIGSRVAFSVGKKSKVFGGKIAFGLAATLLAMSARPLKLTIGYDKEPAGEVSLIGLVIGNGTECAGGMKLTPDARLNDGLFDVLSINNMKTHQRLFNLSKVYSGRHIFSPHFSVRRCRNINILSDNAVSLEGDGEMLGTTPVDIEILPSAIRVKAGNIKI
jgi:YegS/Rv2252/BmrU family lipid kinase